MPGIRKNRARHRLALAGLSSTIAALALPTFAVADVYCFPNTAVDASCTAPNTSANLQTVLSAAQASSATADTVLIGPGTHDLPGNQGYNQSADPANTVQIVGAGVGSTTLNLNDTSGTQTALGFSSVAGSTLRDLSITIPAETGVGANTGLNLGGFSTTRNVRITGPAATNAVGVLMQGEAVLDDSTVDLEAANIPENFAVRAPGGQPVITDSTVVGDFGVNQFGIGSTATVERSTIRATTALSLDAGAIVARNTVIDLGSINGAIGIHAENENEGSNSTTVTADHMTIVGGGTSSFGVRSVGDSNGGPPDPPGGVPDDTVDDGETATVNLSNSVISGPDPAIFVGADRGESASVTTSYSNYTAPALENDDLSGGDADGSATLAETNKTTHATPGFVNEPSGDFHLLPSSPLVDIGDPAPPTPGDLDIDGDPRAIDATLDCFATTRRDIGADELVGAGLLDCIAPDTTVSGKGKVKAKKKRAKVTFTLGTTEVGSSYECSLDKAAFAPCSSPFSTKAKRGKHVLAVRSRDASGNVDPTPATISFKVRNKKRKK